MALGEMPDAGEKIGNYIDKKTGVKYFSLYGKHTKAYG